jgi:acetolactate decarboxylase
VTVDPALAHSLLVDRIGRDQVGDLAHTGHDVVQVHTITSLMEGRYDGEVTVGQLRGRGSFGVGTLQGLDGELVVVDGEFWNIGTDGVAHVPPDDSLVPFAVLAELDDPVSFTLDGPLPREAFEQELHRRLPDPDGCWLIVARGRFEAVTFRSVAHQTPPYRPFAEVLLTDEVLLHDSLDATLVGFCFPDWASELDVPGFHFHMLGADHATGGHVYDHTVVRAEVTLSQCRTMHLEVPGAVHAAAAAARRARGT